MDTLLEQQMYCCLPMTITDTFATVGHSGYAVQDECTMRGGREGRGGHVGSSGYTYTASTIIIKTSAAAGGRGDRG